MAGPGRWIADFIEGFRAGAGKGLSLGRAQGQLRADAEAPLLRPARHRGAEVPGHIPEEVLPGGIEVRRHGRGLWLQITLPGAREQAVEEGRAALQGWLDGGNAAGRHFGRTAPLMLAAEGDAWRLRLPVPVAEMLGHLPLPTDARLRFVAIRGQRSLALRLAGDPTPEAVAEAEERLKEAALDRHATLPPHAAGLAAHGQAELWLYDPPGPAPWGRRDEVVLPVP